MRDWYLPDVVDDELEAALRAAAGVVTWPGAPYDGSRAALAALKDLTSDLIGLFCTAGPRRHPSSKYGDLPLVRYAADVVVPRRDRDSPIAALKGVAAHYVMRADDRVAVLQRQREVVTELVVAAAAARARRADAGVPRRLRGGRLRRRPAAGGRGPGRLADRRLRAGLARPAPLTAPRDGIVEVRGAQRRTASSTASARTS